MSEDDTKRVYKEALKEWLDEKFVEFGKWSFRAFAAAVFVALVYFILYMHGWYRP